MNIEDKVIRTKYIELPDIIQTWVAPYMDLSSADILDFGCGESITAVGVAARFKAKSVTGVDIGPGLLRCLDLVRQHLAMSELPSNLELKQIKPGEDFLPGRKFDLIYSWSVFEHIDQSIFDSVLQQLKSKLKPRGLLFIQISPLYYSAEGSHLFHKIAEPWGHLLNQANRYHAKLCGVCESKDEVARLWGTYHTLNRLTADDLIERSEKAGFRILRRYLTQDTHSVNEKLLKIYNKEVLMTNQVVLLLMPS